MTKVSVCVLVSLLVTGCASRHSGVAQPAAATAAPTAMVVPGQGAPAGMTLSEFIAKARELSAMARPPERAPSRRVESFDGRLAAALAAVQADPSPAALRQVAAEYRRLGIVDRAHQYLQQAMRIDPADAATYDAMARLWRDSGLPALALGDAYRAVYHAPQSPATHNTLGTVFQALGRRADARARYTRALELDATAAYAMNNLCYGWLLDGQPAKAATACADALEVQPALLAARHNLALVYAAQGNLPAARAAFEAGGDRATAAYNLGIVQMARRRYTDAVTAFVAAQQARPSSRAAAARAAQAGKLARAGAGE